MIWAPAGMLALKSGRWTIAKSFVDGAPRYVLYEGDTMRGVYGSADEAQAHANA